MSSSLSLGLIYGSARDGRLCDTVAQWAEREILARGGFDIDVLDPAAPDIARAIAGGDDIGRQSLKQRIGNADAFIVVTPEYNHSFPAPLKALIDSASAEWQAKPVAFVSYGGISGGLRAVEHLRGVFAELHAAGIRDTVSFANAWNLFGDDGALKDPANAQQAMTVMLNRLKWWTSALKTARARQAYADAA